MVSLWVESRPLTRQLPHDPGLLPPVTLPGGGGKLFK